MSAEKLGRMSGILVAPGFGNRGIEGKIVAVHYARETQRSRSWESASVCSAP